MESVSTFRSAVALLLLLTAAVVRVDAEPCDTNSENFRVTLNGSTMFEVDKRGICACDAFQGSAKWLQLNDNPAFQNQQTGINQLVTRMEQMATSMTRMAATMADMQAEIDALRQCCPVATGAAATGRSGQGGPPPPQTSLTVPVHVGPVNDPDLLFWLRSTDRLGLAMDQVHVSSWEEDTGNTLTMVGQTTVVMDVLAG
eukprot:TRINITY_DN9131_c0_g1_i1.p2 TRINITY_DN9131_c0_g1~~TRINITY_DN9131_c0_g1_i1.p2  ORF type:complete len:200 (-),score=47.58 TRINITY_DN9131_c0_g1_i1:17-616(-)